jgi:hypothetical protein
MNKELVIINKSTPSQKGNNNRIPLIRDNTRLLNIKAHMLESSVCYIIFR